MVIDFIIIDLFRVIMNLFRAGPMIFFFFNLDDFFFKKN